MSTNAARVPFSRTKASALLDMTRGLAALIVCLSHWRALFFVDFNQLQTSVKGFYAIPYILTGAGHQAVVIFFVLSGYLVGGSIFRLFARNEWSWTRYLIHRLVRLWIVLLPALCLGAMFDLAGIRCGLAPALYAGRVQNHVIGDVASTLTPLAFVGNLFFTQKIVVGTFGSNGPLWSLANEFWYYILFPCGMLAVRSSSSLMTRLINSALFGVFAWFVGRGILLSFPIWLLGAGLAAIRTPRFNPLLRVTVPIFVVPTFFVLAKTHRIPDMISDYLLGGMTLILLISLLNASSEVSDAKWVIASRLTARFSYTLYLLRVPLLVFLAAVTVRDSRWIPDLRSTCAAVLELLFAIGFAWMVASATEFRTDELRERIEAYVRRRMPGTLCGNRRPN